MIGALKDHVSKLESINRNLLAENEELRQAALDGIEISNVEFYSCHSLVFSTVDPFCEIHSSTV